MGEIEKISQALRDLVAAFQAIRLYSGAHQIFKNVLAQAAASIRQATGERGELIVGIIADEFVFEKEIFFEISKTARSMIANLKQLGIERMVFSRGFDDAELSGFVTMLAEPKEYTGKDFPGALALKGIRHIAAGKLTADAPPGLETASAADGADSSRLYSEYQARLFDHLSAAIDQEKFDYLALRVFISDAMEAILVRHREFMKLITIRRYDATTFAHAANVAILSMYVASKLGFARDDVLDIGIAALFHDIGKLYVSRKLLNKPGKLTSVEFESVKSHSSLGAQLLLGYTEAIGVLPAVVAFEHHLHYNLDGYPRQAFACPPHTASLLVGICDVYDAVSKRRSYKRDYPPDQIYEFMIKEKGRLFDPLLLDAFFRVVGVWPIGTMVCLSDSSIAVVRQENETDIFSPGVEVLFPAEKRRAVDLKKTKPALVIERFLNPLTEAKEYIHLV